MSEVLAQEDPREALARLATPTFHVQANKLELAGFSTNTDLHLPLVTYGRMNDVVRGVPAPTFSVPLASNGLFLVPSVAFDLPLSDGV